MLGKYSDPQLDRRECYETKIVKNPDKIKDVPNYNLILIIASRGLLMKILSHIKKDNLAIVFFYKYVINQ
jgi:hypothetical protein